jgi:predicted RNase H-like nuclease (RuvC/YqgF family)
VSREWADTLQAQVERREQERDAALKEIDGLRRRVLDTEARHDEAEGKRRNLARWLAEAETTNRRLKTELATAREETRDGVTAEWRAQAQAEKRRADGLQKRLDDACGLNTSKVAEGRNWQQNRQDDGRKQPTL